MNNISEDVKSFLIEWRYVHKKPKGAVSKGANTILAINEASARKLYKKQYPHHEITRVAF